MFTNPNAEPLLELLDPDEIVLFGVATDVCDDAAIRGLLARGRRVVFVEEAARGLDEARTTACLAAWREAGVEFATARNAVVSLQAGSGHVPMHGCCSSAFRSSVRIALTWLPLVLPLWR